MIITSNTIKLLTITYILFAIAIIIVIIILLGKHNKKRYGIILDDLEREKNLIINANILNELNKVTSMINSKEIENKYHEWKKRFDEIKNVDIPALTDSLILIEDLFASKKYKQIETTLARVELSIYQVKTKANFLLEEIRELTLSEERNRETVTKLKGKYRNVLNSYRDNEPAYTLIKNPIELQFETIDKLFSAFEAAMEKSAFSDISKIIKALDYSINNLDLVIDEAPEIILMGARIIPKKMVDVNNIYNKMCKDGYNLDYLSIEHNINEAEKKIADIFDRLNVLNLEDSILDLKTISTYFDDIYNDFDKEKLAKVTFKEIGKNLAIRVSKLVKITINLNNKLSEIKSNYNVKEEDIKNLVTIRSDLKKLTIDYDNLVEKARNKDQAFSKLSRDMKNLSVNLSDIEGNLDNLLRLVNSFKEDEKRAHDQLDEIKQIISSSKEKINSYKLPIIPRKYYVELSEAIEAINEMVKELEKKPLDMEVLNTRVDTARDLTLKLYKTTSETVKTASMSEHAIVYGNRYRNNPRVDEGLTKAEDLFFKGCFKASLEDAISAINIVEPGIHERLLKDCKQGN